MARSATTIEGYLSKDPELREVTGHTVTTITVPVTPQKKVGDSWEDSGDTVWYTVEFWDEHGQAVMQSMSKGQLVTVSGTLEVRLWESNGKHGVSVKLANPVVSMVVQKPRRGSQSAPAVSSEPWAPSAPIADGSAEVWNTPAPYDETPF